MTSNDINKNFNSRNKSKVEPSAGNDDLTIQLTNGKSLKKNIVGFREDSKKDLYGFKSKYVMTSDERELDEALRCKINEIKSDAFTKQLFLGKTSVRFECRCVLEEQQVLDQSQRGAFHKLVANAGIDFIQQFERESFEKQRELLQRRDSVGATFIHVCYLFGKYDVGHYLLEKHPDLATLRYGLCHGNKDLMDFQDFLPYYGENILHMIIAARDYVQLKWLVEFCKKNQDTYPTLWQEFLSARTEGTFFQPADKDDTSATCYFGEYPILFAVCSNNMDILDLVLDFSSWDALFVQDSHGNNALHLCVLHELQDMYAYVLSKATVLIRKHLLIQNAVECENSASEASLESDMERSVAYFVDAYLTKVLNEDALTPMLKAAMLGNVDMLTFLIRLSKVDLWTYGPVSCSLLHLAELDIPVRDPIEEKENIQQFCKERKIIYFLEKEPNLFVQKLHQSDRRSAIECLCIAENLECFGIPEVKEIISTKWNRFGFPNFLFETAYAVLVIILLSTLIFLQATPYSNRELKIFEFSVYVFTLIVLIFHFLGDFREIYNHRLDYWGIRGGVRGAAKLSNVCASLTMVIFIITFVSRLSDFRHRVTDGNPLTRVTLGLNALVSWLYCFYFLTGFESTGKFAVIVSNIIMYDIPQFMQIYIILVCGFGFAIGTITLNVEFTSPGSGCMHILEKIWGMMKWTFDGQNTPCFYGTDYAWVLPQNLWVYEILYLMFNISVVLLMLNLIVSMMSTTFGNLSEKAHLIILQEHYNMMCSYERQDSKVEKRASRAKFSLKDDFNPDDGRFMMRQYLPDWVTSGSKAEVGTKKNSLSMEIIQLVIEADVEGNLKILRSRVEKTAEVVLQKDEAGGTLLHWSAIYGNLPAITWLSKTYFSGENINVKCEKGHTAVHDAIIGYCNCTSDKKDNYKQIISTLFNAGASAFARDEEFNSCMMVAQNNGTADDLAEVMLQVNDAHEKNLASQRLKNEFVALCKNRTKC